MKRLRTILLFLVLGAVVNVGVAWAFAVVAHDIQSELSTKGLTDSGDGFSQWWITRFDKAGIVAIDSSWEYVGNEALYLFPPLRSAESILPTWAEQMRPEPIDDDLFVAKRHMLACGWPCISLRSMRTSHSTFSFAIYDTTGDVQLSLSQSPIELLFGIDMQDWFPFDSTPYDMLPCAPLWTGFTKNTIFYAVFIWLLIHCSITTRRLIRHQRGLCVKCAYDLKGTNHAACPECGAKVKQAKTA